MDWLSLNWLCVDPDYGRVGLRAVVLEQSDTLRATGTCLSLWTNAMRVLDVLGIGEKFRTMSHNVLEYVLFCSTLSTFQTVRTLFRSSESLFMNQVNTHVLSL